jgi:hypothetical protein
LRVSFTQYRLASMVISLCPSPYVSIVISI